MEDTSPASPASPSALKPEIPEVLEVRRCLESFARSNDGWRESFDEISEAFERLAVKLRGPAAVCPTCLNSRQVLYFYPRPGSLPGNQMVPCPACTSRSE
jgi:hypothetical protein